MQDRRVIIQRLNKARIDKQNQDRLERQEIKNLQDMLEAFEKDNTLFTIKAFKDRFQLLWQRYYQDKALPLNVQMVLKNGKHNIRMY